MKELLDNIDKLIENHQMQISELQNLRKAVLQEQQHKEEGVIGTMIMTQPEYKQFKRLYHIAETDNQPRFEFMGHTFVTAYAKHMIEYWDNK